MSSDRIATLSSELYVELQTANKNLREKEELLFQELDRQRQAMENEFQLRFEELQRQQEALHMEKERMMSIPARENDVININVGKRTETKLRLIRKSA